MISGGEVGLLIDIIFKVKHDWQSPYMGITWFVPLPCKGLCKPPVLNTIEDCFSDILTANVKLTR